MLNLVPKGAVPSAWRGAARLEHNGAGIPAEQRGGYGRPPPCSIQLKQP